MYTIYYHKKPTVKATGIVHTPQVQAHRTTLDFNYVPMLAAPFTRVYRTMNGFLPPCPSRR